MPREENVVRKALVVIEDWIPAARKSLREGNTVIVRNPLVSTSVAVRYGWLKNIESNLVNSECLPTSLFRTDAW